MASESGFGIITGGYGVSEILPLAACLPSDAVILDIGANIGVWSRIFAKQACDGKIYCFEPSPNNFKLLYRNMCESSSAICIAIACSSQTGSAFLSVSVSSGLHHVSKVGGEGTIEVPTICLDDWFHLEDLARLDFIKIDVEGHEINVLLGACGLIREYRPIVLFEFIPDFRLRSPGLSNPFSFFFAEGYTICRLDKSGFLHAGMDDTLPPDWTNDYVAYHPDGLHASTLQGLIQP